MADAPANVLLFIAAASGRHVSEQQVRNHAEKLSKPLMLDVVKFRRKSKRSIGPSCCVTAPRNAGGASSSVTVRADKRPKRARHTLAPDFDMKWIQFDALRAAWERYARQFWSSAFDGALKVAPEARASLAAAAMHELDLTGATIIGMDGLLVHDVWDVRVRNCCAC